MELKIPWNPWGRAGVACLAGLLGLRGDDPSCRSVELLTVDLERRELVRYAFDPEVPQARLAVVGGGLARRIESTDLFPAGLTFVAPAAGRYRLEAWATADPVRRPVRIAERRQAKPADLLRVAAESELAEGLARQRDDFWPAQRAALAGFARARRLFEGAEDAAGQARALGAAAVSHRRLYEPAAAASALEGAFALLERDAGSEHRLEAELWQNAGELSLFLARPAEALRRFRRSLEAARRAGDPVSEVHGLVGLGSAFHDLSQFSRAFASYREAQARLREWARAHGRGVRPQDEAPVLFRIAASHQQEGKVQPALEYFGRALALYRSAGDRLGEARALNRLGALRGALGDLDGAVDYGRRALALIRALRDPGTEAYILHNLGAVHLARGEWEEALEHNRVALDLRRRIGSANGVAASHHRIALVELGRGHLEEALAHLDESLKVVEEIRARISQPEFRSSYFSVAERFYADYVDLLLRLDARDPEGGYGARAFEVAERTRARTLRESVTDIPSERPTRPGRVQGPLTLAQVQRDVLDDGSLLLQYWLASRSSALFVVSRHELRIFALPARERIEVLARRFYGCLVERQRTVAFEAPDEREARLARADAECDRAAAALSGVVLGPAAPYLSRRRLLMAPDGVLRLVPFAALPKPASTAGGPGALAVGRPMVVDHEIAYVPSASLLAELREEAGRRPSVSKRILVVADPVFDAGDERVRGASSSPPRGGGANLALPRLRYTSREAEAVAVLVPEGQRGIATGFEATLGFARGPEPSRYRILHFASHALVDDADPSLSGIVLTRVDREGRPRQGILRAHEIAELKLSADLVVLSGCSTGLGRERWGEGLMSLERAFLTSGAARVMASRWDVDDAATAELMARFYTGLLGPEDPGPVAALREAQVALWKDGRWRAPFFWAAFGIEGEYRSPHPSPQSRRHTRSGPRSSARAGGHGR